MGFLVQSDDTILVYSQPGKRKLRNIAANPRVALALDETARWVLMSCGSRVRRDTCPIICRPFEVPAWVAKYGDHVVAGGFGTLERFAGSLTSGNRRLGMIPTCRCGCCT